MDKLSLEGTWKLRGEFLDLRAEHFMEVMEREEGVFGIEFSDKGPKPFPYRQGFMEAQVPGDVTSALISNGIMEEPLLKNNTNQSIWMKELSWWFIRDFYVTRELLDNEEVRLFIEMLDYNADIIINGRMVAKHRNAFVPYYDDVKRYLKEGNNTIIIRLTSGVEEHYDRDSISFYCMGSSAICDQRIYLRKPQYTYGWDWCKPVATCGIGRNIYLEGITGAKIVSFRADTVGITNGRADLDVFFEIDNVHLSTALDATLKYSIFNNKEEVVSGEKELYLNGGLNFVHETLQIEKAELWWPNGYGDPHLYTVKACVVSRNLKEKPTDVSNELRAPKKFRGGWIKNSMDDKKIGIRTIEVNHDKRADGTREFQFKVNGIKVWCKGGNWVPTDSIYLRTPKESYKILVEEAKAAHFTMLRIWGGGTYEPDYFYEYCSENGIMLMHDFMYACAFYPDHQDFFLHQATLEAEYQTKRLAHYPCMAMWTGNNEIHESITEWFPKRIAPERFYGSKIFNYIQPKAVSDNCPYTAYAPSSPYYGNLPNDMDSGDSHVWKWLGRADETKMQFRFDVDAFDRLKTRFSSEYGFYGALMPSSVKRFHHGEEIHMGSDIWIHHGEHTRKHEGILEGINKHFTSSDTLSTQEYLLYSGVLQGSLYQYMAESLRRKEYCSGNLIWMYNDCWPETGWTIIDYYLTRKISFYYLKRGFAPKKFIIRGEEQKIEYTILNESNQEQDLLLEYGYMTFAGEKMSTMSKNQHMEPHSFHKFSEEVEYTDAKNGFYYIKALNDKEFETGTNIKPYYRTFNLLEGKIQILKTEQKDKDLAVTMMADTYIPIVYLTTEDDRVKYSNNYFELLPNEEKTIIIYDCTSYDKVNIVKM